MSQRKIGTLLSYIHIVISNTISILYTPYMLRVMGQSEYGLFGTANSFISYLSILSFGIGGAYIRFNARYRANCDKEGEKRLNGMFLTIFSILALFVSIGGFLFIVLAGRLVKDTFTYTELYKLRIIMLIMTLNTMCTFLFNVVLMALQAYERFICIRLTLIISSVVQPILNVIALKSGGRAITITVISFAVSLSCYIWFFCYARAAIQLRFSFKKFCWPEFKELFVFSSFLFINAITDQINFSTDNIVLSAMGGTTAVAIYTVGATFKSYFQNFSSAISAVFAPQVNRLVAENHEMCELDDIFIRVGRVQFYVVALILIGYVSIGKQFIILWAGQEYIGAYWIGLLLILAVFVPSFQNIGIQIQQAMNMHKARSIAYFFIALCNICLTIVFARWWGGVGAAAATTLTMFVGTVLFMNYYYYKKIGLDIPKFWLEIFSILPCCLPAAVLGIVINCMLSLDSFFDVLIAAVAITLVYFLSCWKFSMNQYEKELISKPIYRVLKTR
ncbi:MAG: oligosaccharide flippase family protein [Dysosmobacter sp.]|jgi:O-antigen/teichoic acid export membrane protein|uniref:oligosaccharide flippase family protein n=1 Tax=Dysosmobacter sp. TaxID=2591382 RepID=UPI003D8DC24F